jgi:hypothetical protein
MADIKLKDLVINNISGYDLFKDSENLMTEISDEGKQIFGGCLPGSRYPHGPCTADTDSNCDPTTRPAWPPYCAGSNH